MKVENNRKGRKGKVRQKIGIGKAGEAGDGKGRPGKKVREQIMKVEKDRKGR